MFLVLLLILTFSFVSCLCPNGTVTSFTDSNNCYLFVSNKSEFIVAEGYCRQKGGHLASVSSAFVNMFLSSEADLHFSESTEADFWIGATNQLTPGNWSWLDGKPFVFTDWEKGQPENTSSSNCAASSTTSGLWTAEDCFKSKLFVCMIPAPPPTTTSTTTTPKPTTTTPQPPSCDLGWTYYDRTGYCYHAFSDYTYNWADAEHYCGQYGSHLASIHSQLESDFVADLARSIMNYETCHANIINVGLVFILLITTKIGYGLITLNMILMDGLRVNQITRDKKIAFN
jgi:hypothetical protein